MIKLLALLLACTLLTSAIRNGKPVSADELKRLFFFVVSVKICSSKKCDFCTGSLVSPNTVLLAAHCFCSFPKSPKITVYFPSLNGLQGRYVTGSLFKKMPFTCNTTTSNSLYAKYPGNTDIATIRLHQRMRDINSVPLDCDSSVPTGQRVTMIGYGYNERRESAGTLRIGHTRTTECPPRYKYTGAVCADIKDLRATMTDYGDDGGPLLIHHRSSAGEVYLQVGINYSWTKESDWPFVIDTWTGVRAHCRWIRRAG